MLTLLSSVVCRSTTRCATERRWNISARSTTTPTDPSLRAACLRRRPACASVVGPHRNTYSVASSDIQRRSGCLRSGTVTILVLSGRRCRRRRLVMFVGFSKNSRMERSRTERPSALSRTVSTLRSIQSLLCNPIMCKISYTVRKPCRHELYCYVCLLSRAVLSPAYRVREQPPQSVCENNEQFPVVQLRDRSTDVFVVLGKWEISRRLCSNRGRRESLNFVSSRRRR